jgi:HlyD family secretion protein
MSKKRIFIFLGAIVILLIILSTFFSDKSEAPTVTTSNPTIETIVERVSASGKIQPEMEVNISAEVSGQLISLPVKEGDKVYVGDLLAEINPDVYISARNRAQAAVNTSRSNLSSAKAAKATSKANLFVAEKAWSRAQLLFQDGVVSRADYDQSEAAFISATANLTSASEGVNSANYAILSASASLQETLDNLSRTTLIATQDGVVTALVKEVGESVQGNGFTAGEIVMKISNLDIMEVNVEVNESDIISVVLGNSAEIEVDAYLDRTFSGIVTEIGNTALNASTNGFNLDQVTNFSVKIRINSSSYTQLTTDLNLGSSAPFRPGMSATVDILTKTQNEVICIPIQCVTSRKITDTDSNSSLGVFLFQDGRAVWTPVVTGIQDNLVIEVISGISIDDIIISGPYDMVARKLDDGDAVSGTTSTGEKIENEGSTFSISFN